MNAEEKKQHEALTREHNEMINRIKWLQETLNNERETKKLSDDYWDDFVRGFNSQLEASGIVAEERSPIQAMVKVVSLTKALQFRISSLEEENKNLSRLLQTAILGKVPPTHRHPYDRNTCAVPACGGLEDHV
jgi:hypothetical protein